LRLGLGLGRSARGSLTGVGVSSSASVSSQSVGVGGGSLAAFGSTAHSVSLQASGLGRHRPGLEGPTEVVSLKEIFSDCVSFGERVTSLRSVLSDVGTRVEGSVRHAFEEQKRREALELTKLKKAGHQVDRATSVGRGPLAAGAGTAVDSPGATAMSSPTATGSPLHTAPDLSAFHGLSAALGEPTGGMMPPENTAAAREALARERERLTLLRKKSKMEEADDHIQQAMAHKEKMKKYLLAQDFYDKRERVHKEAHHHHHGAGGVGAGAAGSAAGSGLQVHVPRSAGHSGGH
jgi:hypothetical protein